MQTHALCFASKVSWGSGVSTIRVSGWVEHAPISVEVRFNPPAHAGGTDLIAARPRLLMQTQSWDPSADADGADNRRAGESSMEVKIWLKRLGFWGFLFFLVKGLLWLAIPALIALWATE